MHMQLYNTKNPYKVKKLLELNFDCFLLMTKKMLITSLCGNKMFNHSEKVNSKNKLDNLYQR